MSTPYADTRPDPYAGCLIAGSLFSAVVVLSVAVCGFLGWLAAPKVLAVREAARRSTCQRQLSDLHTALEGYYAEHGAYPPAYTVDDEGRPMHSWRVLLLPHLGEESLFAEYDLEQPWDSEHNQALAHRMPGLYQCPSDPQPNNHPAYLAVVGAETIWPSATTATKKEVADDPSLTLLLVEAAHVDFNWLEPRDLQLGDLARGINPQDGKPGLGSDHPQGAHVLMADGSVEFLSNADLTAEDLNGLATRAGDEDVELPSEMIFEEP